MSFIELDVAHDNDRTQALDEMVAGTSISYEVVTDPGPAGGWPVVRFEGPRDQIVTLLRRYHYDETMFDNDEEMYAAL